MSKNKKTLKTYETIAGEYAKINAFNETVQLQRELFHSFLKEGLIYDFGCGTGRDVAAFNEMGYETKGFDASHAMLKIAKSTFPNLYFEKFDMLSDECSIKEQPDGIWSCASLLHFDKKDFEIVFIKLVNLLKVNGFFYFSVKIRSEIKDEFVNGRFFQYYTKEFLDEFISKNNNLEVLHYEENQSKTDCFGSYFLRKI